MYNLELREMPCSRLEVAQGCRNSAVNTCFFQTQKNPQPGEDEAKVVADRCEDGVGGIAFTAFEIAAPEVTFALHVADRGTPSQVTFDDAEHAALLARDEDAVQVFHIMAVVSLVDKGALDSAAGEFLGVFDDSFEGMTVVGIAGVLVYSTNWPPGARALVVTIEVFTPNS